MTKIKVNVQTNKRIYIHNDILNAAHHLKKHVLEKEGRDETGITLHIMAALSMYAFAYEAQINFIGFKCIQGWEERAPFLKKSKKIFDHLKLGYDPDVRPFLTIENLKKFRDFIAHGKPVEISEEYEDVIESENDDFYERLLDRDYYKICTVDQLKIVVEDIDEIWEMLIKKSGLSHFETISSSSGGKTFIANANEKT